MLLIKSEWELSSSGEVEEVICSNSVVEVQNGLEEESDTYKASCVVVEENGKLGGEHEQGRCELVVAESGKLGEGMASYVMVVVESGRLGEGEGVNRWRWRVVNWGWGWWWWRVVDWGWGWVRTGVGDGELTGGGGEE
ncbi:hypothetical protein TSUD_39670 [Trifolium subterraneum]|uniref:Uncharacterized protein n=1 Tax=Trifolium subterraneum TaxID=3900 RepID=A0A2Z6NN47_TRISU|nr:hypothetical protein TSUD_39670 [Trifolium subterraneum]